MNNLFDISNLPVSKTVYKGARQKLERGVTYDIEPIACYDHFVSKNYEYIILSIHAHDTDANSILKANGFQTVISHKKTNEPYFIAYRKTNLPDSYTQKHNIAMCVYFLQNSNTEIERFLDYYLSQGIDKIFMYYCGNLSDRPDLPQRKNVEYLEWKYIHFLLFPYPDKTIWQHYSQVPLYNVFAKKIGPHCNWSFYSDIDEFIKAPTGTLKDYLNSTTIDNHLFTEHRWAKIDFSTNEVEFEKSASEVFRGKTILKGSAISPQKTVHNHRSMHAIDCKDLLMFHNRYHPDYDKAVRTTIKLN